jgi:hypothetical protein
MIDPNVVTFTVDYRLMYAFRAFEVIGAILCGIVAWQTDQDAACKSAPVFLQDIRRAGLLATSSVLLISAACFSIESMMAAMIFGALNFVWNAIALKQRRKRPPDGRAPVHVLGGRRIAFRPLVMSSLFRKARRDA